MVGRAFNAGLEEANLSKEELALKIKEYVPDFYIHFSSIGTDPDKRNYIVSNERLRETGFQAARSLAIARNTNVCVTLTSNQARFVIGTNAACAGGATFTGTMTRSDGSMPLSNDMQISGSTASVVFTSLGAASPAATYTVRDPATNQTLSVVISAAGRVSIQ